MYTLIWSSSSLDFSFEFFLNIYKWQVIYLIYINEDRGCTNLDKDLAVIDRNMEIRQHQWLETS